MMSPEAMQKLLLDVAAETDPDEKRKRAEEAKFLIQRYVRWKIRLGLADAAAKREAAEYEAAIARIQRGEDA